MAHISRLLIIPNIALTDTEHAKLGLMAFVPFSSAILTPDCFYKDLGKNHLKFKSYFELSYLSSKYYRANFNIKKNLGFNIYDKYVLLRFISWGASHDIGQTGILDELKIIIVRLFVERGYKVVISSEGELSNILEGYRLKLSPSKIHDVIQEADFFIGESGTMATEAAILGTPSIFVNSLDAGVFQDLVKYGLLYSFRTSKKIIPEIEKLLNIKNLKLLHLKRKQKLIESKIDTTEFLIWFLENYPNSKKIMIENPHYQTIFNL